MDVERLFRGVKRDRILLGTQQPGQVARTTGDRTNGGLTTDGPVVPRNRKFQSSPVVTSALCCGHTTSVFIRNCSINYYAGTNTTGVDRVQIHWADMRYLTRTELSKLRMGNSFEIIRLNIASQLRPIHK